MHTLICIATDLWKVQLNAGSKSWESVHKASNNLDNTFKKNLQIEMRALYRENNYITGTFTNITFVFFKMIIW